MGFGETLLHFSHIFNDKEKIEPGEALGFLWALPCTIAGSKALMKGQVSLALFSFSLAVGGVQGAEYLTNKFMPRPQS